MKINKKYNLFKDKEKELAIERTRLAKVRTRLAWLRIILAFIVSVFVILKIMKIL